MISLEELLGIEYPIIQGGMAHVAKAPLVAAVSEAGGLGVLGGAAMNLRNSGIKFAKSEETHLNLLA